MELGLKNVIMTDINYLQLQGESVENFHNIGRSSDLSKRMCKHKL